MVTFFVLNSKGQISIVSNSKFIWYTNLNNSPSYRPICWSNILNQGSEGGRNDVSFTTPAVYMLNCVQVGFNTGHRSLLIRPLQNDSYKKLKDTWFKIWLDIQVRSWSSFTFDKPQAYCALIWLHSISVRSQPLKLREIFNPKPLWLWRKYIFPFFSLILGHKCTDSFW